MEAVDCGDEVAEWMSQFILGSRDGFRLGYYVENICRRRGAVEIMRNDSPSLLSIYKPRDNDSVSY